LVNRRPPSLRYQPNVPILVDSLAPLLDPGTMAITLGLLTLVCLTAGVRFQLSRGKLAGLVIFSSILLAVVLISAFVVRLYTEMTPLVLPLTPATHQTADAS
jgi:hypothetical protein